MIANGRRSRCFDFTTFNASAAVRQSVAWSSDFARSLCRATPRYAIQYKLYAVERTCFLTDCDLPIAECANSPQCAPAKHHYDECVARVTAAAEDSDNKGPNEDCVEECKSHITLLFSFYRLSLTS